MHARIAAAVHVVFMSVQNASSGEAPPLDTPIVQDHAVREGLYIGEGGEPHTEGFVRVVHRVLRNVEGRVA